METLEALQSVLERKAEDFENAKSRSVEAARESVQELRRLVNLVESSIISDIEEAFETNRFAVALGNIDRLCGSEASKAELERLREVARSEAVAAQVGPCRRDFLRAQERIIGLASWSGERQLSVPARVEGRCCGADSVEVVWDRVPEAAAYRVEMRRPSESAFRRVYEGSETRHRVSGLCSGTRLLFRVRSVLGGRRCERVERVC